MPKKKEESSGGDVEPPKSSPEDLHPGFGNAEESTRRNATGTPSFAGLAADANSLPGHVGTKRSLEIDSTNLTPPATKARESNTPGDPDEDLDDSVVVEQTDDEVSVIHDAKADADPSVKGLGKVVNRMSLDEQHDSDKVLQESFPHELFVYAGEEGDQVLDHEDFAAIVSELSERMLMALDSKDAIELDCRGQYLQHGIGRFYCKDAVTARWYKAIVEAFVFREKTFRAFSRSERGKTMRVTFALRLPIGLELEKLEKLIRIQNKMGRELFKITEVSEESWTDPAGNLQPSRRFHAIMTSNLVDKLKRKGAGMFLKVEGRQPVRLYQAWTRPMRPAAKRPASYANAASGSAARTAEAAAAKAPRLMPPVPGSKRSARKEKEAAERSAASAKWSVPVTPLRYWNQTRAARKEIYLAYVEAKIPFPFSKSCPLEIFKLLPKAKQELMTSLGGRMDESKKMRKAKATAKAPAKAPAKASKSSSAPTKSPKPAKAAESASKPAKAAETVSKSAEAASIIATPVLTGTPNPAAASLTSQPSTSWADQIERVGQDASVGKAALQDTPSK